MRARLTDHQLAEIAIVWDDDTLFAYGDGQDVDVFERGRVVLTNCGDIVAALPELGCDLVVGALVEQKPPGQRSCDGWTGE
jgi:hypothetical protein